MFSNNGNYEKDIVRFSGTPFEVSYTGENIVAVTICDKHEVVFYHHAMICLWSSHREYSPDQSIYLYDLNIQCDLM
jgi:hypothetical protein